MKVGSFFTALFVCTVGLSRGPSAEAIKKS